MGSHSMPPSPPPWAEKVDASLHTETQFRERQVLYFPGSPEFADSENDYFNAVAREVQSAAVVRPTSAADVAALLKVLRRHLPADTPIAVRGAGHATYGGTAKAVGGVTIDMRGLRGIDILPGEKSVRIAAGEKWTSVFSALESHEPPLTTVGGRSPNVGVTGFLLGGGLSSLSAGFGFSADMVTAWEVVLASGEVILAKRDDKDTSDLWDALRGGSTNFGIVTAVEMTCFPHPTLFRGANVLYLPSARKSTLKALCNLAVAPFPEKGQPINHAMWCITQYSGVKVINAILTTTGSPEQEKMHDFTSVWGRIPIVGRLHTSTHGKFVVETGKLAPKGGSRTIHKSVTVKLDFDLLNSIVDLWYTSANAIQSVGGLMYTLVLMPLSVGMLEASCRSTATANVSESRPTKSNFQGLSPQDGPLVIAEISMTWRDAKDDGTVAEAGTKYLDEVVALARQKSLSHRFIFVNYAWPTEAVMAGYGEERLAALRQVAAKWDPEGFFQGQFVGGFKLGK